MDPFLLGILVNITTSGSGQLLNKIKGKSSIKKQIELAFENANKRWISNKDIRRKEEIWTRDRLEQVRECYKSLDFSQLDADIIELYKLFEEEITFQKEAVIYLDNFKQNKQLDSLVNIESIVQEILKLVSQKNDEINIKEGIQNWNKVVQYQLKDINHNILNGHHSPDGSKSILSVHFEKFIEEAKWKFKIEDLLLKIKKQKASISTNLANQIFDNLLKTNLNENNEKVRLDLLDFFSEIKPIEFVNKEILKCHKNKNNSDSQNYTIVKATLSDLNYLINNPQYGKCFLIKGSFGSGKTHFVYQMLKSHDFLPVYISSQDNSVSFSKNLINNINRLSCQNFVSFYDFVSFLQRVPFEKDILIVIENIEKFNKSFYDDLFSLMEASTSVPEILWVLSINSNYFDAASEYEHLFKKYIHHFKPTANIDFELLITGGWFDLNYINKLEKIGKRIITKDLNIDRSIEGINYYKGQDIESLNTVDPFLAWIIYEILSLDDKFNFIDFVLLEIIQKLYEYFRIRYDRNLSNFSSIVEFVDFTSSYILSHKQIKFNRIQLQNEIISLASNISDLQKSTETENTLKNLYNIGLFSRDFSTFEDINTIHLNTVVYWHFSVANKIIKANKINELDPFWASNDISLKIFAENVFEYLFLIQEHEIYSVKPVSYLASLFQLAISKNIPKSSFWFACLKMNKVTQEQAAIIIKNKGTSLFDNRHDLFALIQCIAFLKAENYKIEDKFDDYIYLSPKISEFNSASMLLFALRSIISECFDLNILFKSISHLHGIEFLDIQVPISKYIIDRAFTISKNTNEITTVIKAYLCENIHQSESFKAKMSDGQYIWKRYYIREWLIYFFFKKIVYDQELESYQYFKQNGFLTNHNNKFSDQIIHELKRESNIAIGGIYKNLTNNSNDFFEFLDELHRSKEFIDRENCFHIIRHTVPTHGSNKIFLDKKFKKYLINIFKDPMMTKIRKGFMGVFETNGITKPNKKS
jgi:hypothetical protein